MGCEWMERHGVERKEEKAKKVSCCVWRFWRPAQHMAALSPVPCEQQTHGVAASHTQTNRVKASRFYTTARSTGCEESLSTCTFRLQYQLYCVLIKQHIFAAGYLELVRFKVCFFIYFSKYLGVLLKANKVILAMESRLFFQEFLDKGLYYPLCQIWQLRMEHGQLHTVSLLWVRGEAPKGFYTLHLHHVLILTLEECLECFT